MQANCFFLSSQHENIRVSCAPAPYSKEPKPKEKIMNTIQRNSDFPVDDMPILLKEVVRAIRAKTQAPVELIVGSCLCAMSIAAQATVVFEYRDGRRSPVSLYTIVLAESGERKTAVFNHTIKQLLEFQKRKMKEYVNQQSVYEADLQSWNAIAKSKIKQIRKNEEKGIDNTFEQERLRAHYVNKPKKPRVPKILYSDATTEAITQDLVENIGSAGLVSDEGGVIFNGRAIRNLPLYNQLWDGGSIDIERKDRRLIIDDCRFVMLALIQPIEFINYLKKHGTRALGNGFAARCLWSTATSTQGTRTKQLEVQEDNEHLTNFHKRIDELLEQTMDQSPPKVLRLSPESESILSNYQNCIEMQILCDKAKHDALPGILSKLPENAIRLAALMHYFYGFEGNEIQPICLEHMIKVVSYYYSQSEKILTLGLDSGEDDANKLYTWLTSPSSNSMGNCSNIAKSQIRRYAPYQLRNSIRLNRALKILEESGRISIMKLRNPNGSISQAINIYRN
ncbi:hypothetical protein CRN84_18885 [Budvicia aquatica]|uniref:DUF3987 domain-containing protein n=2 Tax=Budvicia aquatica TaxID=82979 RepID=A0A2C6DJ51_9GAMM|nr:hypothetical protein CRN84_18885 [Budvicia aquatica]